ncbi:Gfo/Idh/MocA family protein [Brachybacterium hainanense]|uniref:Gfo/Idh/MocA family oxidoreductase n=1 Tax=Brachybacterium hainanense TaxID=1541174 RepID=A0ABV6R712_9MICO
MTTASPARAAEPAGDAPIRTAILGYGVAGRFFHGAFLQADPDYDVAIIATGDPGRAEQARAEHPGVRIIADPAGVADHAEDLDLVIVCTPPGTHAELARTALQAGLDVVVDKPFTPTSAEGEALIAEAARRGRCLSVYQNRRYDADFLTLQGLLTEGALGTVHTLESRFEWWKPDGARGWKGRAGADAGGGILFDLGTHLIDQAVQLLGPVTEVLADVRSVRGGPDDTAHLVLTHGSGATSRLSMSSLSALEGARFHVSGDRAAWRSAGKDPQEEMLRTGRRPGTAGFGQETEAERGELSSGTGTIRTPAGTGDYGRYYRELAHALRSGGPPPVDPADAVAVLRVIEAAHASRRTSIP